MITIRNIESLDDYRNNNRSGNYSYEVESYAWILNVDKSILKLNPILEKHGYQFLVVSLEELELKFSELFGYPIRYKSDSKCTLNRFRDEVDWPEDNLQAEIEKIRSEKIAQGFKREELESTISGEFYELLMHNVPGGYDLIREHELILLKRIENFEHVIIDNTFDGVESFKVAGETSDFVRMLVQHMRLFKNGDVMCRTEFQIISDTRKLISRFKPGTFVTGANKFVLDDDDIIAFDSFLKQEVSSNALTDLALSTFNLAYHILELKSRFLNYMICLESLFNKSDGEISHTISRHLAIVISKDEQDFNNNYSRIKKLYGYRSKIIHGNIIKEDMGAITEELQSLVRQAINFGLKSNMNRDQLFTYLNARGF
jgi:hypothetical protein